ncbi:MAG: hypothetical protein CMK32_04650 [Porticoccaceae bacterium]|nr:hypothetical protein [Porticoccaceae bacterium]
MSQTDLDTLIAKEQIRDLVYTYCRAIDRKDFDLLHQLYHPGAGDEHGCNPSGTAKEFFEILPDMMVAAEALQHNITNLLIKVEGDYAEGEAYLMAHTVVNFGGEHYGILHGGRYLDKYERRNGVWKFTHRRVVADWLQKYGVPPCDITNSPEIPNMQPGSAGADDTSYGYFRLFKRGET